MEKSNLKDICRESVFEKLFKTYAQDLKRFLYYKFKDLEAAEDVLQETFIKLWKNCHKVIFEKAKSYIYTVANNAFLDIKKHEKIVREHRQKAVNDNYSINTPEYLIIEKEYLEQVEKAIDSLSEKQRTVFVMSRFEDKKYREIAEILNISVKAVEKRMQLALLNIKNKIGRKI